MSKRERADYQESHKDIKQAMNYEYNLYADDTYDSYMWEIEKEFLLQEISSLKNNKIKYLDFACGTGRIISIVEPLTLESTGVDVSTNMLSLAKDKVKRTQLINGDITKEDIISDKRYELITAFRFFLNAQDDLRKKVMYLMSEKLTQDGTFIFNIHGNILSYHLLTVILGKLGIKRLKLHHMSYFGTLKLIKQSNLKLERVYGVGFVPSSFYKRLKVLRRFFIFIDNVFPRLGFIKYFARDLMFVCTKKPS